jgi:hypothetical protein
MKRILLIGHAPEIHSQSTHVGFPQLRTWSIHQFLLRNGYEVETLLVPDTIPHTPAPIPYKNIDAAVTAGPFSSAYAALSLPKDIPLWLDWPSDPRADLHARIHGKGTTPSASEQAFVSLLHRLALRRADAIGVISHRQYWATLSTLMDWRLQDPILPEHIHFTPIAFDFPFTQKKHNANHISQNNIALCGSLNSWFDTEKARVILEEQLTKNTKTQVHIFGGHVPHNQEIHAIQHWIHPRVHVHGWLPNDVFHQKISTLSLGFWMNRHGVEPLLGSRTRALLFAWMGMDIAASCDTELMVDLHKEGLVWDVRTASDLSEAMLSTKRNINGLREYCHDHFSPSQAYSSLHDWLKKPYKRPICDGEPLAEEVLRLREALEKVHNSQTWRWGSRLHRFIKKCF